MGRTIRMLGLTVTAALMAMALTGASSAMAESTALCTKDPGTGQVEVCPQGALVAHVHEATLPGNENRAKLLTSIATIQCQVLFLGDAESEGLLGAPLLIEGAFTYTECNFGCSIKELNGPAELRVLKLGHESAEVTGEWEQLVNCPGLGIHCIYNGTGLKGTALGPLLASAEMGNGELKIEEQGVTKAGEALLACPATAKLDLLLGPLTETYIAG